MASFLKPVFFESFVWKVVLFLINLVSPASSNDNGRSETPPNLSDLPNELLIQILALTLASEVPLDLRKFIELGQNHQKYRDRLATTPFPSVVAYNWFREVLPTSQEEHYLDWLAINGTSRRFRECGKELFFSKKVFIVTLPLLKALLDGSCKNLSGPDKAELFARAKHVIVSTPATNIASCFINLSLYNAFTKKGCVLSVQPYARDRTKDNHLPFLALDTASTPMAPQPAPNSVSQGRLLAGTLKRHSAPQRLLSLLEGAELEVGRMVVDLIHRDTEISRRWIIDDLAQNVYHNLVHIGWQKAKRRAAEDQRS